MSDSTRRGFLIAGAGVAAAGVAAAAPSVVQHSTAEKTAALPAAANGSMLVHVKDVRRGELALMVHGREVTVTDHKLVAQLAHAMHSASQSS